MSSPKSTATPPITPAPYDPARGGIIGIYALRALDRGDDPRQLVNAHRALRYGNGPSRAWEHRAVETPAPHIFGRATPPTPAAVAQPAMSLPGVTARFASGPAAPASGVRARRLGLPTLAGFSRFVFGPVPAAPARSRRLATAGLVAALAFGWGTVSAGAQDAVTAAEFVTQEYVVQPGDTIASVAATFGIDPLSIATASGIEGVEYLLPEQVLLIPIPVALSAEAAPTSPGMVITGAIDAYVIAEGDTLGSIAAMWEVPTAALIELNGITNIDDLVVGTEILIPIVAEVPVTDQLAAFEGMAPLATEPVAAAPVNPVAEALNVPTYQQSYPLSSPYAAATIATAAFGAAVPESAFVAAVPLAENPHWGYRGNLYGEWGSTTDYGVYSEPLVPVLNANGFAAEGFYAAGEAAALTARVDAGQPVIVWLGLGGETAYWVPDAGAGSFELTAGMVAVVAYGYDDAGVFVSNPLSGTIQQYGWDEFMAAWNVLGGMSLAVFPY